MCQGITVTESSDISLFHMIPQQCSMVIWPVNQIAVSLKHIFQRFLLYKTEPRKCQSSENALAPIWRATSQLPNSAICLPPILYLSLRGLGICEMCELTFSPQHSAGGEPRHWPTMHSGSGRSAEQAMPCLPSAKQ